MTRRPPTGGPGRRRQTRVAIQGEQGLNRMDKVDLPARVAKPAAPSGARRKAGGNATARKAVGVLVLGMHRSGTSALTRVLNLHGVALGTGLMSAGAGNTKGFWEKQAVADLNDRLLTSLDRSWVDPRPLPDGWASSEAAAAATDDATELLAEFYREPLFAIKDPRIGPLLPVWLAALDRAGVRAVAVCLLRDPAEVAASLAHRDGWPEGLGSLLWSRSTHDTFEHLAGVPHCIIRYDALLRDWRAEIGRLSAVLAIELPRDSDAAAGDVEAFLDASERHVGDGALWSPAQVTPAVSALYRALVRSEQETTFPAAGPGDAPRIEPAPEAIAPDAALHFQYASAISGL